MGWQQRPSLGSGLTTDYSARVSGVGDGAVAAGSCGVGGVSGAAGCEAAGCFFWPLVVAALRAAALRLRVFAALRPAARCLRVAAAFLAAARCLRVAAAFSPALFLGLISSSVTIREGIRPDVACLCKDLPFWRGFDVTCFGGCSPLSGVSFLVQQSGLSNELQKRHTLSMQFA